MLRLTRRLPVLHLHRPLPLTVKLPIVGATADDEVIDLTDGDLEPSPDPVVAH